ncbi:MAG: ATP-binding protein [Gemmatimonadaceae bacterium]
MLDAVSSAVFAISVDAIVCTDASQRIILFNAGAEHIFGYAASEVLGRPLEMLLPEYARPGHQHQVEDFGEAPVVARRMGERGEIAGRRKSGEIFPAEASISHVDINGNRVYTAVLRDMSERRQAEIERASLLDAERAARSTAEAATRARDVVLAVVSHDLRNPLSTIGMCAGALEHDGASEETRQELLSTIRQAAEWMNRLIQDLLDVGSIEAGHLALELGAEHAEDLIARATALFEPIALEAGLTFEAHVEDHLPELRIDAERVMQVLANLVMNACKFTDRGGRVTLRVSRAAAGGALFSVEDTGCGIAADALPYVFESFWQNRQRSTKRGTGLGLAIAHGIVEAHGGTIEASSAVGRGSVFSFTLPA